MSVSATIDVLEARVKVHADERSATIDYFAVEAHPAADRLQGFSGVRVTHPRKKAHLVKLEVAWDESCNLRGMLIFDLARERKGADIPSFLPLGLRYHLLMTSAGVFEYLADMTS